jgi:hypothetical protein
MSTLRRQKLPFADRTLSNVAAMVFELDQFEKQEELSRELIESLST